MNMLDYYQEQFFIHTEYHRNQYTLYFTYLSECLHLDAILVILANCFLYRILRLVSNYGHSQ